MKIRTAEHVHLPTQQDAYLAGIRDPLLDRTEAHVDNEVIAPLQRGKRCAIGAKLGNRCANPLRATKAPRNLSPNSRIANNERRHSSFECGLTKL